MSVNITWSGGAPNSYVLIYGSSSTSVFLPESTPATVSFDCIAPVSAGTFTIPSAVLQSLPAASATSLTPPTLTVENAANPVLFSASGLDLGYVTTFVSDSIHVTYQSNSTVAAPQLQSISLQSSQASSGASAQGTVTLSSAAPSSGITVAPASSSSAVTVPSSVTVAAGATSATFTATLGTVASAQTVTITATYGAASIQTQITVNPPTGVDSYNGSYTGTYSGSVESTKVAGSIAGTVNDGTLTVTEPGSGSATINASGQVSFGVVVGDGVSCTFTGTFVVTGTSASGSGNFSCSNNASGTWSITRQSS